MKTGLKVLFIAGMLGAAATCSNGNNSPQQAAPSLTEAMRFALSSEFSKSSLRSITNPQSPCYRPGAINNINGQQNPNSIDIGSFQQGGTVVIRNRQFVLSRGWASENTADNCTVDKDGLNVGRPTNRALRPGTDNFILSFDNSGLLTISLQTGVGQVRSPSPVNYTLDGQGISFPAGISLRGQPSGAYVAMESRLGFGMLRATDKQMADQLGISNTDQNTWARGLPTPSIIGNTGYNTNYVFNSGAPNLANAQTVVPLGGTSLVGNGVNQLAMDFPVVTGQVIVNPSNPLHVNEIYFDALAYSSSSLIPINGTDCQANADGQMLKVEVR